MTIKNRFPSGASTETEVALLMQLNLEPGEIVPYDRIGRTIGIRYGTSPRFRTIVAAWARRVFREQRLQSKSARGIGIRFLTEEQALAKGIHDTKNSARGERRIATRVKSIDSKKLSVFDRTNQQNLGRYLQARDHAARMAVKELASPKAVTSTVIKLAVPEVSASDASKESLAADGGGRLSLTGNPSLAG